MRCVPVLFVAMKRIVHPAKIMTLMSWGFGRRYIFRCSSVRGERDDGALVWVSVDAFSLLEAFSTVAVASPPEN